VANKKFEKFINEQAKKGTLQNVDWTSRLRAWEAAIESFYDTINDFLQPYLDDHRLQLKFGTKQIIEEFMGEYKVRTATIMVGAKSIQLEPVGAIVIGARGRIDMTGPRGAVKFVLVDKKAFEPKISARVYIKGEQPPVELEPPEIAEWDWKIATEPPVRFLPLTDESFFDALMVIADG
jgi:hypothetical protein